MKYAKFLIAALAAAAVALQVALTDDKVTNTEWLTIVLAGLGALGVLAIPNKQAPPKQ